MGRFRSWEREEQKKPAWDVHPIWRGIGCILFIIIPVISYAGATLLVEANNTEGWYPVPRELTGPAQYPYLFANLAVAAILAVLGFVLLTVLYSLLYRVAGPPQYGPLDAPPPRRKPRKRR
jgi:hypothetical protein